MTGVSDSKIALYEGLIAFAWADHELADQEREAFHQLVNDNSELSDEQRARLNKEIDNKVLLEDVWPRITDKDDRRHLLDLAHYMFTRDGNYCEKEKALFEEFYNRHIKSFDFEKIEEEMTDYLSKLKDESDQEEEEVKEWASQEFGFVSRLKGFLKPKQS